MHLERLMRRKIWLDNGSYLVVDHTEALTVIDVNTGKYTGSVDLEQTAFETNAEAAAVIARLLRLRDIGGIAIVDFIDMHLDEHRAAVKKLMEDAVKPDRTKTQIVGWTKLGLMEMTRKKLRHSSGWHEAAVCAHCGGTGRSDVGFEAEPADWGKITQ
jgi:ribonuclease G